MRWYLLFSLILFSSLSYAQFDFPFQQLTASDSISYLAYNNAQCIAVYGQTVHVVFTDKRDGAAEVFYKQSTNGGVSWGPDIRLTADDNVFSGRATIAVWHNDVHVVWMDHRNGNYELYYKHSINNGTTWSNDIRLTSNASLSENPSLAIDAQTLHLVWNDSRTGQHEIFYKRSTDGGSTWTNDMALTNQAGNSLKPCIALTDTLLHIVWEDQRNGNSEIFYKRSADKGLTWSSDIKISNSSANCNSPCVSANGDIAIITWDDHRNGIIRIYGRRSQNGGMTWSAEVNYVNDFGDSYDAHHVFSGTYAAIIYTEINGSDADIYFKYSTDAALTWIPGSTAIDMSYSESGQPFLAVEGAIVHVLFQDDFDGNLNIMYNRNRTANPFTLPQTPVWAHQINSPQKDIAFGITSDINSNVFVTGSFSGTVDFDSGPGIDTLTSMGSTDAFIYKMSPLGNLLWARRIGGAGADNAYDIAVDRKGNILLTGSFRSTVDFDPGPNEHNINSLGREDIFVVKLDQDGNFKWAKCSGGAGIDEPQSIAVSDSNDIYITGYFAESVDFDPGPDTSFLISNGNEDIFIIKLTEQGDLLWANSIGGTAFDAGRSVMVDDSVVAITGGFRNTVDFDPSNSQNELIAFGAGDIFILQLNAYGQFNWVRRYGGSGEDEGNAIVSDTAGNVYVAGYATNSVPSYKEDAIVYALSPSGNFRWYNQTGNGGSEMGKAIAVSNGYLYVAGIFDGLDDFDESSTEVKLSATGGSDIFLQKLNPLNGSNRGLNQFGGSMEDVVYDLAPVSFGKIGLAGDFNGIADFSPSILQQRFVSGGQEDGFVTLIQECEPSYDTLTIISCPNFVFNANHSYSASGTYTILVESASGCDSIITLDLTILDAPHTTMEVESCDSYTTSDGIHTWTESGIYADTTIANNGCDSIITYNVTILKSTSSVANISACDVYIDEDGNSYTESGSYTHHLVNAGGCDSTRTINLTLGKKSFANFDVDACHSYTTPEGDHTWTQSGIYMYTILNASGCDSNITLNLTIVAWDTTILQEEATLTAVNQPTHYQWLDCNASFSSIDGENGLSFTALMSGSYAVAIGSEDCIDTSSCHEVEVVGIEDPDDLTGAIIFPNPTRDVIYVLFTNAIYDIDIEVTDGQGKVIRNEKMLNSAKSKIGLPDVPGIYFITLKYNTFIKTFSLVKL